ncbi:hypothetical protein MKZ25_01010 [Solibacillus sp. FSL W7-1464]|uniref:hypothetical protein n=1 Tax=Solibacillus sp. FSL W7-1464 TaxID=2921706 RepID=UPI0030F65716
MNAVFMLIAMLILLASFVIWGVSFFYKEHFIVHEMMNALAAAGVSVCFGIGFIGLVFGIKNWFGKMMGAVSAIIMIGVGYSFAETSALLYKDKVAYENQDFEEMVALPIGEEYEPPDYGLPKLMKLEFEKLTIDVYNLEILRRDYEANWKGKPLEIVYLPNSRFAVSVKEYVE